MAAPLLLAACSPSPPPSATLRAAPDYAALADRLAWERLPDAPTIRGKQDDVYFISSRVGWSVNGEGNIFRTTDGGDHWERVLEQPGTFFRAIVFTDSLNGFAGNIGTDYFPGVTDPTPLYRTRDGGLTWTPVQEIRGPYPKGICNFTLAGDGSIWASGRVGGPSFLLVSRDGGESWESRVLTSQIAMLIDVHFPTPDYGILVGGSSTSVPESHSVVLATTDGGASWREIFRSVEPMELAWKIDFPTPLSGYVSVMAYDSSATFLKTEDGGHSWRELPLVDGPYLARGVGFLDENVGWMAGERPGMPAYRTLDGGHTWEPDPTLAPLINRFRFVRGRDGSIAAGYAIGMTIQRLSLADLRDAPSAW
jgi:photosystem II stability/assembly factor-like uncharacterized protein